jgi:hypothetical protein
MPVPLATEFRIRGSNFGLGGMVRTGKALPRRSTLLREEEEGVLAIIVLGFGIVPKLTHSYPTIS